MDELLKRDLANLKKNIASSRMREIFTEEFLKTKEVTFSTAAFKQKRSVTVRSQ